MGLKILVVDDNHDDLETMKQILESAKYSVTACSNGAQALEALKRSRYGLMLIDIKMEMLSGYELVTILKEKMHGKMKLAYVSVLPKNEVNLKGVDGFIQKPFGPAELLAGVKKLVAANGGKG